MKLLRPKEWKKERKVQISLISRGRFPLIVVGEGLVNFIDGLLFRKFFAPSIILWSLQMNMDSIKGPSGGYEITRLQILRGGSKKVD